MRNRLTVHPPRVSGGKIECLFTAEGEWSRLFRGKAPFFAAYPVCMEAVPPGVAVLPFLCNVLPMAWICGATVELGDCDADFYRCIPLLRAAFAAMYPMLDFGGEVRAERLSGHVRAGHGSALLFSGGVDSTFSLISHLAEKPALLMVRGADIPLTDEAGWSRARDLLGETALIHGLEAMTVSSSLRNFFDEESLARRVKRSGELWWHGFQHGLGLIGLAAPWMYLAGLGTLYIASSFCPQDGFLPCGSHPTIDNAVRFCGCEAVHDGFTFSRQEKIGRIASFPAGSGKRVPLRVCWEKPGGGNCCRCEKCARTMLALEVERVPPEHYGFRWDEDTKRAVKRLLLRREDVRRSRLEPVRIRMRETRLPGELAEWSWLTEGSVEDMNRCWPKRLRRSPPARLARGLWRRIRRIFCI